MAELTPEEFLDTVLIPKNKVTIYAGTAGA
jgi:hypothetical protein